MWLMLPLAAMFPEAVKRYHDLLGNHELAESSRAPVDEGLERARLIFGGRRLVSLSAGKLRF